MVANGRRLRVYTEYSFDILFRVVPKAASAVGIVYVILD